MEASGRDSLARALLLLAPAAAGDVLTGRNGPGRARTVANRAETALTGAVRSGLHLTCDWHPERDRDRLRALDEAPRARKVPGAHLLVGEHLQTVAVRAAEEAVHPDEEDVAAVAADGRTAEDGHTAEQRRGLAQVLAADAALGAVLDDHSAEGHAAEHPAEAEVGLQQQQRARLHSVPLGLVHLIWEAGGESQIVSI